MTLAITPDGATVDSLSEIVQRLEQKYRDIYGADIDLDQDSPDGQRVGIQAKLAADVQAFALHIYNNLDPDFARGVLLDRLLKITGTPRRSATRSTWDIDVTTDRSVTLPEGYTIIDDLNQSWFLPSEIIAPAGTNSITFRAVSFGAISNTAGAELSQGTVVLGVTALNAPDNPLIGRDQAGDPETRRRRARSTRNPAYSTVGSLFARLAITAGVTDLEVYENKTDLYDPVLDLAPNSYWCVVEGGLLADIAKTIALNKTGGTGLKGAEVQTYVETRERPDGVVFDYPHFVKFDRPTLQRLFVKVRAVRKKPEDPVNVSLIAQRIAQAVLYIGSPLAASELYDEGYGESEVNFYLQGLEISTDGLNFTNGQLRPAPDSKFTIDAGDVVVTEVLQ